MQVSVAFWENVFSLCRAPLTSNLIDIFDRWQVYEGGLAANNPLNATRPMTGSRPYNTDGVQDYASAASGASATSMTLLNGRYPSIVAAMRADAPINNWSLTPIPAEVDTWGTSDFAAYLRTLTPEEDSVPPQTIQQIQDIWEALFAATPPNGPAPWNNAEIIRRQLATLGAPYDLHPGPVPTPAPPAVEPSPLTPPPAIEPSPLSA